MPSREYAKVMVRIALQNLGSVPSIPLGQPLVA